MRRAAKRDDNEKSIVNALLKVGAKVRRMSAPEIPDLLCGFRGSLFLLEVKNPEQNESHQQLTKPQEIFFKEFHGYPVAVVRTTEQALQAIGAI